MLSKKILGKGQRFRTIEVVVIVAILAIVGVYFILRSHAASCTLPGDANCDGAVNVLDLSILATNWGKTGMTWSQADFNADGAVNILDLSLMASHWGNGVTASSCQFVSSPGATPAFCDDLTEGASAGGRAGDLNPARWSVTRAVGANGTQDQMPFPSTPVSACKSGVTTVNPDRDILACDGSSSHSGQLLTAMSAQNYGLLSMRPRQPFDFAGRTGTISFNVDAVNEGGLSWWPGLFIGDEPYAAIDNSVQVLGIMPKNGIGLNFDDTCNTGGGTLSGANAVFTYSNYVETTVTNGVRNCVTTQRGSLNHVEVRLSQTNIEIWASDFSTDGGKTFSNFRKVNSFPINLSFSRGYVYFMQAERAPLKYTTEFNISPTYTNNYWSDLGFDGPVLTGETGYSVGDALTIDPNNGAHNIGYGVTTTGIFDCCSGSNFTNLANLTVNNVNLTNVTSAMLTFDVFYTYFAGLTPDNVAIHYSLNGGAWQNPSPVPDYNAELLCTGCPGNPGGGGGIPYAFHIPVNSLVSGTNTINLKVDNAPGIGSYAPVLTGLDLLTFTANAPQ